MSKLALVGLIVFAAVLESPKVVKKLDIKPEVPLVFEPVEVEPEVPQAESTPTEAIKEEAYKQEAEQYKAEVSRLQDLLQEKDNVISGLEQQLEEFNKLVVYKANEPKQVPTQQVRSYTYSNCSNGSCSSGYGRRGVLGGFFRRR